MFMPNKLRAFSKAAVIAFLFYLILFSQLTEAEVRHTKKLTGLTAETIYNYRIKTTDLTTGIQYISSNRTFTTSLSSVPATTGYHAPAPTNSLIVNVLDTGATPNNTTDDTAAIQAAINQVGGTGGTVLVPAGTYMVNAVTKLTMKSNMTFKMQSGAVLKAIPNSASTYHMLYLSNVTNVNIVGGKLQGERHQHGTPGNDAYTTPKDSTNCPSTLHCWGEWGMGISIYNSSNIYVEGTEMREMWGDGSYVSNGNNINFYSIIADDNRRQAISLIVANGVVVRDSILKNTYGHKPQDGIDFEPNDAGTAIRNVQLINNVVTGNRGSGFRIGVPAVLGTSAYISNVTITGNTITGNGYAGDYVAGIMLTGYGNYSTLAQGNTIKNNIGATCAVQIDSNTGSTITNNTLGKNIGTSCYIRERFEAVGGNVISPNTLLP
jgi:hypothetical protein